MSRCGRWARLAGRYAVLELRLYAALLRWCLRRKDVPAGAEPWGYAQLVTPVLWLWVFGSATELVVLHLLIPWERTRLVVDVISAWGLVWMLGMLAAYRIRPHLLQPDEVRVRNGVQHDVEVPLAAVAAASARETGLPSSVFALQLADGERGTRVSVGVSGRTNVLLELHRPTALVTAKGTVLAQTVSLWPDEPRRLVERLRVRTAPASDVGSPPPRDVRG